MEDRGGQYLLFASELTTSSLALGAHYCFAAMFSGAGIPCKNEIDVNSIPLLPSQVL
jgi:hypothetical protein